MARNGFSPLVKRTIVKPPTQEQRQTAVRVIKRKSSTDAQFEEIVAMLDLKDLVG